MDPPDSPIPSPQTVNKNVLSYNLFDKIRSAYVQKEMASFANTNVRAEISEGDLNKIFINEFSLLVKDRDRLAKMKKNTTLYIQQHRHNLINYFTGIFNG